MSSARREARLRPEHARLYPGIVAGHWRPAAELADQVLSGFLLRGLDAALRPRALAESHFEFRGGDSQPGKLAPRPSREDRVPV